MAYKIDHSHEVKNFVRRNLWKGRTKPFKHILTLTSPTCGDIIDGMNRGLINTKTRITIFEKEASFVKAIREKLHSLGLTNFSIISRPIETSVWYIWWEQKEHGPYDLIYLDFCGNMTQKIWNLLNDKRIREIFSTTTTAFTFSLNIRNNYLIDEGASCRYGFCNMFESGGGIPLSRMKYEAWDNSSLTWVASQTIHHVYDALGKGARNPDSLVLYKEDGAKNNMLFMRIGGKFIADSEGKSQTSYDWRGNKKISLDGLLRLTLSDLQAKYKEEMNPARKAWVARAINIKSKG